MKNKFVRERRSRLRIQSWFLLVAFVAAPAAAQTLDEQYVFYLDGKCSHMDFAREQRSHAASRSGGTATAAILFGPADDRGRWVHDGIGRYRRRIVGSERCDGRRIAQATRSRSRRQRTIE